MGESFKDLVVWQRAVQLTVAVYKLTSSSRLLSNSA